MSRRRPSLPSSTGGLGGRDDSTGRRNRTVRIGGETCRRRASVRGYRCAWPDRRAVRSHDRRRPAGITRGCRSSLGRAGPFIHLRRMTKALLGCARMRGLPVFSPLPPGEGPGVRGRGRGFALPVGRYPSFPHPKPLSQGERGLTPRQPETTLPWQGTTVDARPRLTQAWRRRGGGRMSTVITIPEPGPVTAEEGAARPDAARPDAARPKPSP